MSTLTFRIRNFHHDEFAIGLFSGSPNSYLDYRLQEVGTFRAFATGIPLSV
jgi:hypothetical protein